VVIGNDCPGSCKSNYHTITTTTAPNNFGKLRNIFIKGTKQTVSEENVGQSYVDHAITID